MRDRQEDRRHAVGHLRARDQDVPEITTESRFEFPNAETSFTDIPPAPGVSVCTRTVFVVPGGRDANVSELLPGASITGPVRRTVPSSSIHPLGVETLVDGDWVASRRPAHRSLAGGWVRAGRPLACGPMMMMGERSNGMRCFVSRRQLDWISARARLVVGLRGGFVAVACLAGCVAAVAISSAGASAQRVAPAVATADLTALRYVTELYPRWVSAAQEAEATQSKNINKLFAPSHMGPVFGLSSRRTTTRSTRLRSSTSVLSR
jgi:hypothetical protein